MHMDSLTLLSASSFLWYLFKSRNAYVGFKNLNICIMVSGNYLK